MTSTKRRNISQSRAASKKLRNAPDRSHTAHGAKTACQLSPRAIREIVLFFGKRPKMGSVGCDGLLYSDDADERQLLVSMKGAPFVVPQLKHFSALCKEWRFAVSLLRASRHGLVNAMSPLSVGICAKNATLEWFLRTLFSRGDVIVLARVLVVRGMIDIIAEEFKYQPAEDIQMRPLIYVCDDIPKRPYPAIRHDSLESLWRTFKNYRSCGVCTTRRKTDAFGRSLLSCRECDRRNYTGSTLLAPKCEEFDRRYAVKYHVRRPDMLDRWLTIELQYGWEIVTPWGNYKDEDVLPNTLEVAITNHYRNYQTLNFMRPMCIAIYLDSNARCKWRTEPRRSLLNDSFVRMDAFHCLPRPTLDSCQIACRTWRNQIEDRTGELALRDFITIYFDGWNQSGYNALHLTLTPLFADSVCETRSVSLKQPVNDAPKNAKIMEFNALQVELHLQNSFVRNFAHSPYGEEDFARVAHVPNFRIGNVVMCGSYKVPAMDACERFGIRTGRFHLYSTSEITRNQMRDFFQRADEVLDEYTIVAKVRSHALDAEVLGKLNQMRKCRRASAYVDKAGLVDLDQTINHLLTSVRPNSFEQQMEFTAKSSDILPRPSACSAPAQRLVNRLPDVERSDRETYEVYEFPCKGSSDVLTVAIGRSVDGKPWYRFQIGPFQR